MDKRRDQPADAAELRRRAEELLAKKDGLAEALLAEADTKRLIHELRVHQAELELQNEELCQARAELEASLARYSDLYDFAPAGYFTLDGQALVQDVNLSGATLLGAPRSQVAGQRFDKFLAPASQPAFYDFLARLGQDQGKQTCQAALAGPAEGARHLLLEGVALQRPEGDAPGPAMPCRLAVVDITEQRQAEEDIRAKTATLGAIFASAPYVMLLVDGQGRVKDINHAGVAMAQRDKPSLLGLLGGEIFGCLNSFDGLGCGRNPVCSDCPVRTRVERTFATGRAIFNEEGSLTVLHGDQPMRLDMLISTSPLPFGGEGLALVSVVDISERKKAEDEQEVTARVLSAINIASEKGDLLRAVLGILKDWTGCQAVGIRLREGDDYPYFETSGFPAEFVHLENHLCTRDEWGRAVLDAEGRPALDCMCGNIIRGRFDPAQSFFTNGGGFWSNCTTELLATTTEADRQARTRNRCNSVGYESVALIPLRSGAETFGLMQFNDKRTGQFSEQKIQVLERLARNVAAFLAKMRAEEDKAKTEAQLRQAQKMEAIGTLAGGIAHDFNNILATIVGYAEIAKDDALAGVADPEDLEQIIFAAGRARDLVRQILAFSRKTVASFTPLDLSLKVEEVVLMLERTLPKEIAVQTSLDPEPAIINGDGGQMGQVLMNLATNARDAMPEGGRMTFATSAVVLGEEFCRQYAEVTPGDYIRLKVSDSGQGMDQHTLEHMYDPFFTTKAVGKGTGLGLSTIHGIVKSHGGHIFCSSAPGRGTSFDIYLPALAQNLADPAGEGETGPQESGAGRRILLVDDEESLRTLGTRALQTADYEVVAVSSGEEALQAYRQGPPWPDVVVLDLGMPGMGGVRCLKAMLEINPRAKVLVASGYAADAQVKDALAAGAVDYVAKPFQRGELLGKIWQLLRGDGKA